MPTYLVTRGSADLGQIVIRGVVVSATTPESAISMTMKALDVTTDGTIFCFDVSQGRYAVDTTVTVDITKL